ncbi:MAG: ABC transporter permease [Anaerolineae bacterium]|nr:ABC transporter permease subunit [Anaerolineae bacterium]
MRNVLTVFRRELTQYLTSPVAYLIAFAVLLMGGFIFNNDLAFRNGKEVTSGAAILSAYAQFTLFFAPLLTMRLFSEENREGTLELLMTLPIKDNQLALGKFLGAWAYYTLLLVLTLIYQIALVWLSPPDLGVSFAAYMGVWLLGGACIAIGMIFSALNENQIVAAFLTLTLLLLLWQADQAGLVFSNRALASLVRSFSFQTNYLYSFAIGLVRLENVVFFVGVIAVSLFITTQIVESRRWR